MKYAPLLLALLVFNVGCITQESPTVPKEVSDKIGPKFTNLFSNLNSSFEMYGVDNVTFALAGGILRIGRLPSCKETTGIPPEIVEEATQKLYNYKNFAEGVHKSFKLELPYLKQENLQKIGEYTGACTLLNSYNELVDSGDDLVASYKYADEKVRRQYYYNFYLDLAHFTLNVLLMESGIPYRVAYKSVGLASNTLKFQYISAVGGPTVTKVTMSVAHWEIRDKIWMLVDEVGDEYLIHKVLNPENFSEEFYELLKKADKDKIKEIASYIKKNRGNLEEILKHVNREKMNVYEQKAKNASLKIKEWFK